MNTLTTNTASAEVLSSWKEIAQYLSRGVRTVQRWEAHLGLPIRRPGGKGHSAVIAMRAEIDVWLKACPLEAREQEANGKESADAIPLMSLSTQELLLTSRQLRQDMHLRREQCNIAINQLVASLEKMMGTSSSGADNALSRELPPPRGNGVTA